MLQLTISYIAVAILIFAATALLNRRGLLVSLLVLMISCITVYTLERHKLVPYNAGEERRAVLLTGDEPDYLLTALSIARDFDIEVSNNIEKEDWKTFQQRPVGGGDYTFYNRLAKGRLEARKGQWGDAKYMQHRPGISVFVSPVFAVLGSNYRWWSYFLISACLTGFAVVSFLLARPGHSPGTAAAVILLFLLSPPVIFYANQVYPEAVCGILLAVALLLLSRGNTDPISAAVLLALSVWFSDRALPSVMIISLFLIFRLPSWRSRAIAAAMLCATAVGFALYCYHRFAVPWPVSHNHRLGFSLAKLPIRLFQIIFDSKQGWLWQFPSIIIAPFIFADLIRVRKSRSFALVALGAIAGMLFLVAVFDDWRGGTHPRGRYYVMPQIMLLPVVLLWLQVRGTGFRLKLAYMWLLGALSITISIWVAPHPAWWFRNYHPLFGIEEIQPLYTILPALPDGAAAGEWLKMLAWLCALLVLMTPAALATFFPNSKAYAGTRRAFEVLYDKLPQFLRGKYSQDLTDHPH